MTAAPHGQAAQALALETRRLRARSLAARLNGHLETMREALEDDRPLDALDQRPQALSAARLLHGLLETPEPLALEASPGLAQSDPASLQHLRRTALADLERLKARLARLESGEWRTPGDALRAAQVRGVLTRYGAACLAVACLLAGWFAWQQWRAAGLRARLEAVRQETASKALDLIALNAWQARRAQGRPLAGVLPRLPAPDACAGQDLRAVAPDHPCRAAWSAGSQALFNAAIPAGGKPIGAPSEVQADPWGSPYILYLPPDSPGRVVSPGPDGLLGTADDLARDIP